MKYALELFIFVWYSLLEFAGLVALIALGFWMGLTTHAYWPYVLFGLWFAWCGGLTYRAFKTWDKLR